MFAIEALLLGAAAAASTVAVMLTVPTPVTAAGGVLGSRSVRSWLVVPKAAKTEAGNAGYKEYREYEDSGCCTEVALDGGVNGRSKIGDLPLSTMGTCCKLTIIVESMCAPGSGYVVRTIVQYYRSGCWRYGH